MFSEGFGWLGKLLFSWCNHLNLASLQSIHAHCFPDGRTRKEGLTAGWAGISGHGEIGKAGFLCWLAGSFTTCDRAEN